MRVGIVGSRGYRNRKKVEQLVETLIKKHNKDLIIVSGGCQTPKDEFDVPQNVDVWAERYTIRRGILTDIKYPDLKGAKIWVEIVKRYYARNEKIVLSSNIVFVFLVEDKGGAWNTVKWCRKHDVPLVRIYEDGRVEKDGC